MPDLFGLDLAGIINDAIGSAGGVVPGVLLKKTQGARQSGNVTGGRVKSTARLAFEGYLEEGQVRIPTTRATVTGSFITILGASISGRVAPSVNDSVEIEGREFELTELMTRDPAAATYMFRVQGGKSIAG